jgi:hypothetical protein
MTMRVAFVDAIKTRHSWGNLTAQGLLELVRAGEFERRVFCPNGEHQTVELRISRLRAAVLQDLNLFNSNQAA